MTTNMSTSAVDVTAEAAADIEMQSLHDLDIEEKYNGDIEIGGSSSNSVTKQDSIQKDPANVTTDAEPNDSHDVWWNGPDDPDNPMNWPPRKRWFGLILISIITFITPLASSMFAPGIEFVENDLGFHSVVTAGLVVSIYILGYAFAPLIVAPLSEIVGRVPVYNITNVLYVIFTICCGLSNSVGMLIAFRFLAGCLGSTPLVLGGGSIADTTPPAQRAGIMSLWAMGPLLGPVVGPIAGGFLAARVGWRWVFYVIAIAAGVVTIAGFFFLHETYHPIILEKRAAKLRKETGDQAYQSRLKQPGTVKQIFLRAIIRPMKLLFLSPICAIFSVYMAVIYGYLYLIFTTISPIYIGQYHWAQDVAGLSFLGIGIGMFAGLFTFGFMAKKIQASHAGEEHKPEWRLPPMIPGGFAIPVGLFLYGWTAEKNVFWLVPLIGTGLVGFGLIMIFMPVSTYLVDTFLIYAASATAANTVLRSLLGALLPLAGGKMYEKLGLGWGNSLLAFIALAMTPLPFIFLKYGEHIRTKYKVQL